MGKRKLCIAVPASVVSDTPHLREKTSKIGFIGRAVAIFRVDEIIVYPDNSRIDQRNAIDLIVLLLSYMETPQYLRKRLFELRPQLRYVGILPPLRTPHHPLNRRTQDLRIGEYREGATSHRAEDGTLVDIGVEKPALIIDKQFPPNKRVTVKITNIKEQVYAELVNRDEIPTYWGYDVVAKWNFFEKLGKNSEFDLTIATSKYGVPLTDIAMEMGEKWKKAHGILVVFGAPTRGLYEIFKDQGLNLDDIVDFVINTLPLQGTETIRTEEALIASLAILNTSFGF